MKSRTGLISKPERGVEVATPKWAKPPPKLRSPQIGQW